MEVPSRAALFFDLASLAVMSSHHGVQVAHGRLLDRLTQNRRLVRAAAYGARDDDHPDSGQRLARLSAEGFKVIAKPLRRRADGVRRASLGVDIAVDALELAPYLDELSLLTTDADLSVLIEAMQRRGVRVEVVTSRELAPPGLVEAADAVIEFEALLESVSSASPRARDLPTERGNARPRLDPPPRRRSQRRPLGKREPQAVKSAAADTGSDPISGGQSPPAQPPPASSDDTKPPEPSESASAAPVQPAVKVLPQEKLTGRTVRASLTEA